ncbi:MAG TPA: hypothetical protein VGL47_23505, partial [Amycolatopsis sp.]|uniref:hypothetical protein n=1 Tax=Amycolatopsis sp. TaxID=37632 RepID=UPI002F3EED7F
MRHQLRTAAHRRRLGPVPARLLRLVRLPLPRLLRAALAGRPLGCATARIGTLAWPGAGSIVGHGAVLQCAQGSDDRHPLLEETRGAP